MSDDRSEARDSEEPEAEDGKPEGLPEAVSSARAKTPVPDEKPHERPRPAGLVMTPSMRLKLELVPEEDDEADEEPEPARERGASAQMPFETAELKLLRSLGRWITFSGLMTLTVGALTGLSYATGEGSVAHVVVGILATAFALWLLAAAFAFYRVTRAQKGRQARHHLVTGFSLLRGALLLKTILLFSAMALGCFVFSLAVSVLFLL